MNNDKTATTFKYLVYYESFDSRFASGFLTNPIDYHSTILEAHEIAAKCNKSIKRELGEYIVKTVKLTAEILD